MQILVEGRLRTDEWADKATGQPRQAVRVVASQVSTVRPYNASVSFQLPASCLLFWAVSVPQAAEPGVFTLVVMKPSCTCGPVRESAV